MSPCSAPNRTTPGGSRAVAAAATTILRRLAGERPLVVAIDDAQWLDSTTADALMFAARRLGDAPVGFIATVRTPVREPATLLGLGEALPNLRIHRLSLGPLSVGSLYHVFAARLGRELPRSTIERIAEASGGNPFHALEIARQVVDGGRLDAAAPLPVPETILDAARDRIRRLPPATRGALLRVAALSRPTTALVAAEDLAPAEAEGLVHVGFDGRIAFSHPLFGAAVYCDATSCDRRVVHASLAAVVTDPEEQARHEALAATGPDGAVAARLAEAGRRARSRGATAAAAELAELAVRLTPLDDAEDRLRREIEHAGHLNAAGQTLRAQEVLEEAVAWAPPGEPREEARLQLGLICRQTDRARSIAHCEEALANATTTDLRARAEASLGLLYEAVDIEQASRHSAAAAALFEELGDAWSWADATIGHCWQRLQLGHGPDEATFQRALDVQAGLPRADARWSVAPMVWALAHDDLVTGPGVFLRWSPGARQHGAEGDLGLLTGVIAQIDAWRGDYEAADAGADEAVELARLGGSPMTLADALRLRANIDAFRGRFDRARETLGPGWAELVRPDEGRFTQATQAILGHIAHATGDAEAADRHFTAATAALEATGIREMVGYRFLGDHVEAVLALGDVDRAEAIVGTLDRQAATFPRPWTLAVRARARGSSRGGRRPRRRARSVRRGGAPPRAARRPVRAGTDAAREGVGSSPADREATRERGARAGPGPVRGERRGAVGRTRQHGAEPDSLPDDPDGAHRHGAAHGRAGGDWPDEPRDRGGDVRQPQDRRGAPGQRLRQARDSVAGGARRAHGDAGRREPGRGRGIRRDFLEESPVSTGSPRAIESTTDRRSTCNERAGRPSRRRDSMNGRNEIVSVSGVSGNRHATSVPPSRMPPPARDRS